jgi:hypothetical protein
MTFAAFIDKFNNNAFGDFFSVELRRGGEGGVVVFMVSLYETED